MKHKFLILFVIFSAKMYSQYAPAVGEVGTTAIHKDSTIIKTWASSYVNYIVGSDVDTTWQHPEKALGKAEGLSGEIVCLGNGGEITLVFEKAIINGEGADFATFENAFTNTFLELSWVEASKDGIHFFRFPNYSLTSEPVSAFGDVDPEHITGYCSKYRQGFGTPFDLQEIGLDTAKYIKIIDIIGDSSAFDTDGNVIYDPYPTTGSGGVDIDAIAVINNEEINSINNLNNLKIDVYPTLVNQFINLDVDKNLLNSNLIVKIFSVEGCEISEFNINNLHEVIDLSYLKTGIYILNLGSFNVKFVKN